MLTVLFALSESHRYCGWVEVLQISQDDKLALKTTQVRPRRFGIAKLIAGNCQQQFFLGTLALQQVCQSLPTSQWS